MRVRRVSESLQLIGRKVCVFNFLLYVMLVYIQCLTLLCHRKKVPDLKQRLEGFSVCSLGRFHSGALVFPTATNMYTRSLSAVRNTSEIIRILGKSILKLLNVV